MSFAPIYTHLMQQNQNLPFGEREKHWQLCAGGGTWSLTWCGTGERSLGWKPTVAPNPF